MTRKEAGESVCPARFGHIPATSPPHFRHIFLNVCDFTAEPFRREISHSVEGLIYGVYFNKINNSTYLPLIRELCHKNEVKILLRIEISFVNVECGISLRNGGGGVVRAVPAPPSARGVRTAVPCVRWWKLNFAPNLRSVNTEHAEAPGTREAEIAKAILPIDFCSHRRCRIVAIPPIGTVPKRSRATPSLSRTIARTIEHTETPCGRHGRRLGTCMLRAFRPHLSHIPVAFPPHLPERVRFHVGTFLCEISHSVEGVMYGVYFL